MEPVEEFAGVEPAADGIPPVLPITPKFRVVRPTGCSPGAWPLIITRPSALRAAECLYRHIDRADANAFLVPRPESHREDKGGLGKVSLAAASYGHGFCQKGGLPAHDRQPGADGRGRTCIVRL